ncbi:MAG: T9SS type A sorting domain-containing protein [candidate division WOR-3 bacterium]|nr:T9SS type A sorting domain-containing protein [candidate division WOR-3 bacterium]
MKISSVLIIFVFTATACFGLSYVESSNGLQNPLLEGGRTEMEFADINNDGNVDILSIGDHGSPYINTLEHGIMVWFGDGQGNWDVYQEGEFGYGGIAVGDVNNDGLLDVGFGMHHNYAPPGQLGTKLMEVALGNGTGRNWVAWDSGLASHGETWGMFGTDFADFNNDGWLDMVSNSFGGSAGVHAYLNYHNGFWDQSFGFIGGMSRDDIVCGDINNDGNVDFAVGQQYGTAYFGDGTGNFTLTDHNLPPPSGQRGRPGVALGDIDNDGAKELSFVDANGGIDVWKWNPAGDSWVDRHGNLPDSGYQTTQLYDMNCDGFIDVIGFGLHIGKVWTGDGTGNWTEAATFSTPTPGDFKAFRVGGDVDHNGFPDIVLVDDEGTSNYRNTAHCFKESSVPDSLCILPMFPRGWEKFYAGSVQFIDWVCAVPTGETALVSLDFSSTGPSGPWSLIASNRKNSGRFQWTMPNVPSANCYIRYTAQTLYSSDTVITVQPFVIVEPVALSEYLITEPSDLSIKVFPNITRGVVNISYYLPNPTKGCISLYTVDGRKQARFDIGTSQRGKHQLKLDVRALCSGIYFCHLKTKYGRTQTRIVVP